jgi:glycopeptide antibiotics resistance protein
MYIVFTDIAVDIQPLAWLVLIVFLVVHWRRKQCGSAIFCNLIFGIYLLYAIQLTFFPMGVAGDFVNAMRQNSTWLSDVNLIPFYIPQGFLENEYLIQFVLVQFASNILLTVPFGFGVNFIVRLRRKDFLWLPFAVGFGIELSQLVINWILGYLYRVVDVTDALLNAAGVLIGYGIFRLFSRVYLAVSSRIHKEPRGYLFNKAGTRVFFCPTKWDQKTLSPNLLRRYLRGLFAYVHEVARRG